MKSESEVAPLCPSVVHQTPLSMGFYRQGYWSELPFPSPGDLPIPRTESRSCSLQADSLLSEPPGKTEEVEQSQYLILNPFGSSLVLVPSTILSATDSNIWTEIPSFFHNTSCFLRWYMFKCCSDWMRMCVLSHSVMSDSLRPMDWSPSGFSVHGILQARRLEWIANPFSRGSSQPRDRTLVPCVAGRFFTIWATGNYWSVY